MTGSLYHFERQAYNALAQYTHEQLLGILVKACVHQETMYEEHLHVLSLLATFALGLNYYCGLYRLPQEWVQEQGWNTLLIIDIPAGQLCWPIHDKHLPFFRAMPLYKGVFFGYPNKREQLHRLLRPKCAFLMPDETQEISAMPHG